MTGASALLLELLAECLTHGIRLALAGDGGLTIDAPRDALTPDLLDRLRTHKAEVLAMLRPAPEAAPSGPGDAAAVWQAALDRLESDPLFPPDLTEALRAADAQWADDEPHNDAATDPAPEPDGREDIDAGDVSPCPKCGSLVVWWDLAGGVHCLACDPPTTSRRLMDLAERIRRRPARPADPPEHGTFHRKRKKYEKPPKKKLKNCSKTIANPGPCPHHLDPATWAESPDPGRAGWVRTVCRRCGRFLGYRPGRRR